MSAMLTTRQLQDLINVDRSTIYRMADSGRLPAVKVGRQWRFPADEVEGWLGRARAETPSPSRGSSRPSLAELLPGPVVQGVADFVAEVLGVMVVVTDMDGRPLTDVSNPCGYFATVAASPAALDECVAGWRDMASDLNLQPRFAPSRLGFLCAHSFVRVGPRLAGMVMAGGIAPPAWPPASADLEGIAARLGLPTRRVAAASTEVYFAGAAEQARIVEHLPRVGHLFSKLANERSALLDRLDSIAALAASPTLRSTP